MKASYDKIVRLICGDNWNTDQVPVEERDGGYGVAMCLAYMQRVNPRLNDFADAIGCAPYLLDAPYKRLQINGIFCNKSFILRDQSLLMDNIRSEEDYDKSMRAWCHIAGLASGFVGKGSSIPSRTQTNQR